MTVYKADDGFNWKALAGASVAFGVFDGLHAGHCHLLGQAVATRDAGRAVALTFDIDPDEVFHPDRLKKLMRNDDRIAALAESGVDDVVALPFDHGLYTLGPEEFLAKAFPAGVPARIHIGEDFRFGARAAGTVADLRAWGKRVGCAIHPHHLVSADGEPITATRIRKLLAACALDEATRLLGRPYALRETVQRGRGDGTGFGFATANLHVGQRFCVLGEGVYAAYALIGNTRYKAAVSAGISPTFESTSTANMEAHVLDFEGDLVGCDILLEFIERVRPLRKFASTGELIATVTADIERIRNLL